MLNLALVDADSIYFRIAWVVYDHKTDKLDRMWKKTIRQGIDMSMREIQRQTMAYKMICAIKGEGNFRKDLYPEYKAHRPAHPQKMKDALNYGVKHLKDNYEVVHADGMEADDLVAIWAYECMEAGLDYYICGLDKDLLQIPGKHYNYSKKLIMEVNEDYGHRRLMIQCLTGDAGDNIPGIYGIGPVKAAKILEKCSMKNRWSRVKAAWRAHKAGDVELSYRLLRMLTTWEELDEIQTYVQYKTLQRERHDRSARKTDIQEPKVSDLPE